MRNNSIVSDTRSNRRTDALRQHSNIDTGFINGELVESQGKFTNVEWTKVRTELRTSVQSIMERSEEAPAQDLEAACNATVQSIVRHPTAGKEHGKRYVEFLIATTDLWGHHGRLVCR